MAQSFDDQFRRVFDSLAERVHADILEHAAASAERLAQAVEVERQNAAAQAAHEAAISSEHAVTARLTEAFAGRESQVREETRAESFEAGLLQGRAEAVAMAEARAAESDAAARASLTQGTLTRLVVAARALDAAQGLTQTLDALATAARAEAIRVALLLRRERTLRPWGTVDFATADGQVAAELNLDDTGVIADAVRSGSPHIATSQQGWPALAGDPSSGAFVAVPLTMNGQVIAVLCADHPSAEEGTRLALTCELLARHAARALESLTARRLAQTGATAGAAAS